MLPDRYTRLSPSSYQGVAFIMSVEDNQRPFLYQRLYDYVLDEIRTGRLSIGDRVPSEMELRSRTAAGIGTPVVVLHAH